MAKPLPKLVIPPATSSRSTKLSYKQLRALWIQAGGNPSLASTMAAIALAESGGRVNALNDNPKTGDYSVGPWQINYYGGMRDSRTKEFGPPSKLQSDPLANAKAAVAIAGDGSGLSNWTTYTKGAYLAFLTPETPQEKAATAAANAAAEASNPNYVAATTSLSTIKSQALASAKAQQHVSDPWVTVQKDKNGNVTGFGTSTGENPPKNALLIAGQPATKSVYDQQWTNTYSADYEAYTGKPATPAQQAAILEQGLSGWQLRDQLSKQKGFTASPVYQQYGKGFAAQAKQSLGTNPPADFVRKAIAQEWSADTFQANLRALPEYTNGPEYKNDFAAGLSTYEAIYGTPDENANAWLKQATLQGWSQDTIANKLRTDPAYKFSPEFGAKAINFLDAMGLFTGARPTLTPESAAAVAKAMAGSKLSPALDLQAGLGNMTLGVGQAASPRTQQSASAPTQPVIPQRVSGEFPFPTVPQRVSGEFAAPGLVRR